MLNKTFKRILKDFDKIEKNSEKTFKAYPYEDDMFYWRGYINGPPDSAYDGMTILFEIFLDSNYPIKPPNMKFLPKSVFHPNVYFDTGAICLGMSNPRYFAEQMDSYV
jgi:ubiquitin-protein ligase